MATHRKTAPRKRSKAPVDTVAPPRSSASKNAALNEAEFDGALDKDEVARALIGTVEEALRADASFDDSERKAFAEIFSSALQSVLSADESAGVDPAPAQETIDELRRYADQADAAERSSGVMRQVETALASLERDETKLALEFSNKLESEGQEKALAWLREQQEVVEMDVAAEKPANPGDLEQVLRSDAKHSRIRRPRGPPPVR